MSMNIHVVKKHQECGSYEAFNWQFEEFHAFLDSLGCMVDAENAYSRTFECDEDLYKNALDILKTYKKKGDCKQVRNMLEYVKYSIDGLEKDLAELGGLDYVLKSMEKLWKEREKNYGWITFSAW